MVERDDMIAALRRVLALAKGNPELEAAVEKLAIAIHAHGLKTGYEDGMRDGLIRGRRRAKGLPEIPKRRGRPMGARGIRRILNALPWDENK